MANEIFIELAAAGLSGITVTLLAAWGYSTLRQHRLDAPASTTTSMRRGAMRQKALRESPVFRLTLPWLRVIVARTGKLELEMLRDMVRAPYSKAGYPGGLDDDEVVALGLLIGALLAVVLAFITGVFLGWIFSIFGLLGLPLGFFMMVWSLHSRGRVRELRILQALPYMLDLMVLMLRSGTSLRIALARVVSDYQDHPIGDEIGQVLAEIDVGSPRIEAFRKLAQRLQISDMTALSDSIVQSEELGWPLAESLERLADRLSSERVLRAQAKAGAAGVIVMIPSTLVLAAAVLLLFAPHIVRFLRNGMQLE